MVREYTFFSNPLKLLHNTVMCIKTTGTYTIIAAVAFQLSA